jgi:hypothetical protein
VARTKAEALNLKRSSKWLSGLRPTTEEGSNPKDELGDLKVPLDLLSGPAQVLQAMCMDDGNIKYGPYNYRVAKVQARVYLAAAKRHLLALIDGEDFDQQTGKPHIGYVLATAGIYADAWVNGFLIDNRPLPGKTGELISFYNEQADTDAKDPSQLMMGLLNIIGGSHDNVHLEASPQVSGNERTGDKVRTAKTPSRRARGARRSSKK